VLVAEVLEGLTVARGRGAIRDLLDLLPRRTTIRRPDGLDEIAVEEVRAGDVVVVKPGSHVPVDGVVVAGHSFVDEATITGESLPIEKVCGGRVYAGTTNQSGMLEIRVGGVGRSTAFGKIIEVVERAEASRAPIQRLADRLAGYLVYFALGAAAVTFLITRDPRSTIAVVIVAGACGIAAGTPLAILGAIGQAARRGAIVKGGRPLEVLAHVDLVVFDKTGTLTHGVPAVTAVSPAPGVSVGDLLHAAAVAEARSEHPFARAILKSAADHRIPVSAPDAFAYTPGRGIVCRAAGAEIVVGGRALLAQRGIALDRDGMPEAQGSEIFIARDARFLGRLEISDTTRDEARAAVGALRALGIRTIVLTGDDADVATSVGRAVSVDRVEAELLPEDKLARIDALRAAGHVVMMVGDGVNDAPALTRADVGVAMGSGTDVARETAGIMLLGDDLRGVVETLRIARRCYRIILTNFVGTLVVDGGGVLLASVGLLNPLLAAFVHVTSELLFLLNSARLLRHAGTRALGSSPRA
jgi:Cd2+/Zn2+-exporting ATPase/Cu+-exporting ATPase